MRAVWTALAFVASVTLATATCVPDARALALAATSDDAVHADGGPRAHAALLVRLPRAPGKQLPTTALPPALFEAAPSTIVPPCALGELVAGAPLHPHLAARSGAVSPRGPPRLL